MMICKLVMSVILCFAFVQSAYALQDDQLIQSNNIKETEANEILTRLPNGLTVYIIKDTRFPLALTRLYVNTGSANERLEQAGISHLLEHMVFKGTKSRPKGQVAKDVEALGGYLNAATSFDRTWYLTDMPKEHWQMGLDVVYDMAFQALLDAEELASEKEVVISELQGGEDNPSHKLFELLQTSALEHTVYGRPIIGYEEIIRKISAADLKAYRDYWYQPSNMQLLVAGDINPQEVLKHVHKLFDHMQNTHSFDTNQPIDFEHAFSNKRVLVHRGQWNKVYLGIAFPAPTLRDLRSNDLDVLCYLLGGDATSHFYRTYKYEKQLVDSISVDNMSLARGGMLYINVVLDANKVQEFWQAFTRDLATFKVQSFSQDSLKRAIFNIEDSYKRAGETLNGLVAKKANVQFLLGGAIAETNVLERLRGTSYEQLAAALNMWFDVNKACVRVLAPKTATLPDFAAILEQNWPVKTNAKDASNTYAQGEHEEIKLANGCKLILLPDTHAPYVSMNLTSLGGNALLTPKTEGLSHLTAALLTDGAGEFDAQGIERYLAERAISMGFTANRQTFTLKLEGPSNYLADMLNLTTLVWNKPTFAKHELAREQKNMLAALRIREDQPLRYLFAKLRPFIYQEHVYGFDTLGTKELVQSFTVADVQKYWQQQKVEPFVLACCGSFNKDLLIKFANQLASNVQATDFSVQAPRLGQTKTLDLHLPGRNQAHLLQLFQTVDLTHADAPALMLLSSVLSGQSGLLFSQMRDQAGLGYTVTAFTRNLPKIGWFALYIGTVPDKLEQAAQGFKDTLAKICAKPLDPQILQTGVNRLRGAYVRDNQSLESRANEAALNAILGYPYKFKQELLKLTAKVTPEQLRLVARKYLQVEHAYSAILQP